MLCRVKVSDGLFTFTFAPPTQRTHPCDQPSRFPPSALTSPEAPRQRQRFLPALPCCGVALGRLEQPLIADVCLTRLRLRACEKPGERWCSLCAHTHRACVCVCGCVWLFPPADAYLLASRTLPQTRPPPLCLDKVDGCTKQHAHRLWFPGFVLFHRWSHDPRANSVYDKTIRETLKGLSRVQMCGAGGSCCWCTQQDSNLQNSFFCLCFIISSCTTHAKHHLLSELQTSTSKLWNIYHRQFCHDWKKNETMMACEEQRTDVCPHKGCHSSHVHVHFCYGSKRRASSQTDGLTRA